MLVAWFAFPSGYLFYIIPHHKIINIWLIKAIRRVNDMSIVNEKKTETDDLCISFFKKASLFSLSFFCV